MTSKEASAKMEKIAKLASDESDKIFAVHDREVAEVKRLLEHQIQWYERGALGELHDVLKKATDTCNKRYVSLQSLVQMVDSECKPLLAYKPYKKSVKAVAQVIADLNEDSVLNTDFGLSVNDSSMEDVAMVSYSPSLEALMIQKFWEQKVLVVDETSEEREILKVEREEQRKRDEERKKREAEEKKRREEEQKEKERQKKAAANALFKRREEKIEFTKQKENELKEAAKKVFDKVLCDSGKIINDSKKRKEVLEKEVSELGFFAFSEKGTRKKEISELDKTIIAEEKKIKDAEEKYKTELATVPFRLVKFLMSQNKNDALHYFKPVEFPAGVSLNKIYDFSNQDELRHAAVDVLSRHYRMKRSELMEEVNVEWHRDMMKILQPLIDGGQVLEIKETDQWGREMVYYAANEKLV